MEERMFTVVATFKIKPDKINRFKQLISEVTESSEAEGLYILYIDWIGPTFSVKYFRLMRRPPHIDSSSRGRVPARCY